MNGVRATRTLVAALVVVLATAFAVADVAGATPLQVPCTPGIYNCPGGGQGPTGQQPPPAAAELPTRGSLSTTGIKIAGLLLAALILLVLGRILVHLGRRRRRSAGSPTGRAGIARPDRPIPGAWAAFG